MIISSLIRRGSTGVVSVAARPWRLSITAQTSGFATSTSDGGGSSAVEKQQSIKKSVFISQSHDVFTNLALEDWIYRNYNFAKHHVLMLWINDPCVVIGRHQNPFAEANVSGLMHKGIAVARRNSGGGTVYHDSGNLNCTFFTARERYNRRYNLNLITRALFREWSIKADISDRDDILLGGKKISGTAAKLGQPNAYHHCTLLVNSNKASLGESLSKDQAEIKSRATKSVPSPIKNLVDVNRHVNISQLLSAIGYEFLRTNATELVDGGREQAMRQQGFQLINPTEKWFPGITELRNNFESWDWRFGKTPTFSVERKVDLRKAGADSKQPEIKFRVDVEQGLISEISLIVGGNEKDCMPVVSQLKGVEYNEDNFNAIYESMQSIRPDAIMTQAINGS